MGPGPTHPLPNYFCYGEFGDIKIKLRVEVTAIAAADNLGQRGQSIIWAIPAETTILPSKHDIGPWHILFLQNLYFFT